MSRKAKAEEAIKPDALRPIAAPEAPATLISPVASDEVLVENFKRYIALRDKLLEEHDYIWNVAYKIGATKEDKKFFKTRKEAEPFAKALREKGIKADLEKKVKKSGCLKLKKAFGISIEILSVEEKGNGVKYTVRATAPNGQKEERTGRCDRQERGRQTSPFDHIDSIALTRATNRATLALLGGETSAEEWEENVEVEELPKPKTEAPKPPTSEEIKQQVDEKFAGEKAAKPVDHRKRFWGDLCRIIPNRKRAEAVMRNELALLLQTDSTKDLTPAQLSMLLNHIQAKEKSNE